MAAEYTDVFYQNVASSALLSLSPSAFLAPVPLFGFFYRVSGAIIAPIFYQVNPMNQEPSTLYAKLLGETSTIEWQALQPFFAKGDLLWVDPALDLIEAAQAVTQDDAEKVAAWMASGVLGKMTEAQALDVLERDPQLWAVVVSPWVMVQERA
jgi:hypothetical protein